jgi:hypothetical protein
VIVTSTSSSASLPLQQQDYTTTSTPPPQLSEVQEHAPDAVKTGEIKNQFGRKVAIVR